ncbi:hypothetical protein LTR78_003384 [Recurvomyces mirabilis]|uniref:T6SS Phospholipase effector Tle1-like catalytic domain-containing protein n=1 Tax=Recurvomyces mirabilis TaxID=574656 RepID=A0AAE1C3J7_9PEZI|nr:hypothetical protein LTR78_003384 [Recurvomyces mirabilis]KAK5154580.1 hypothetical protein LTS14_006718 [Recurvomyces mirabilis]
MSAAGLPRLPRNIRALKDGNTKITGRNVVVCLDGTGDKFDSDNSNIVHFVSCLKKSDPSQITYYQSGIGTYDGGGLSNGIRAGLDMAVGSGLGVHVCDAYKFLMENYHEGDRICIFGFSRGAYTARCLGGMVHKVGILPAHNVSQVQFAYEFYKDDTKSGWDMSCDFKKTFCADVSVHFIGVFDSVASVGFIPRRLPLSSTPYNKAAYFRHAMALDERRAKFKVCRFQTKDNTTGAQGKWETVAELHENAAQGQGVRRFSSNLGTAQSSVDGEKEGSDEIAAPRPPQQRPAVKETDVLEVWFTGAHADVGGGAVKNEVRHKLAQVPLRWMIRQCFETNTGIIFRTHRLAEEGIDVHTLWPTYTPQPRPSGGPPEDIVQKYKQGSIAPITRRATLIKPVDEEDPEGLHHVAIWKDEQQKELDDQWTPEYVEDWYDALSPVHDQLKDAKGWWILEYWPIKVRVQPKDSEEWIKKVSFNLGRYRPVQDLAPNLHWTVEQRMRVLGYKTRVRVDHKGKWNIIG